jgi:DNA polymerase
VADELQVLLGAARAHLEVEAELGIEGVRVLATVPATTSKPAPASMPRPAPQAAATPARQPQVVEKKPGLPLAEKQARLDVLAEQAKSCTSCVLHEQRKQTVFARGNPDTRIVFVGEGPGRDEDEQGFPFVGKAGQLLDKMIAAMGFERDAVYICNVVKCRPPENRTPRVEESVACSKFLVPQVEIVAPEVIVALGRCAAQALGAAEVTGPWRGRWSEWHGVPVMPTYHPAFLLRSPEFKRTVWEDLQLVMKRLGMQPPPKRA